MSSTSANEPEDSPLREDLPFSKEWYAVRLYRWVLRFHLWTLKALSGDLCQRALASANLSGVLGLGSASYAINIIAFDLPRTTADLLQLMGLVIIVLTVFHVYSIKAILANVPQPGCVTLCIAMLSIFLFGLNVSLMTQLHWAGRLLARNVVLIMMTMNIVVIYYTFWLSLLLISGVLFCGEFLCRALVCRLSRPFLSRPDCPLIVYPLVPAYISAEKLIATRRYLERECQNKECAVCLRGFREGESVKQLACHPNHIFHPECLHQWLCEKLTCPICRAHI